mgnify:CR=1 FL=1
MSQELPVVLHRHRGYEDSDPAQRDQQSKKTYDRFLQRFRGRDGVRWGGGTEPEPAGTNCQAWRMSELEALDAALASAH